MTPPSVDFCTTYPTISAPPLSIGAVHCNVAPPVRASAVTDATAAGGATGEVVTHVLAAPRPAPLVAYARNTYATPLVRPVIVAEVVGALTVAAVVQLRPPSTDLCTVYEVIADPPLLIGALQETVA